MLESDAHAKHLVKELSATSAIILSNEDPFELYGKFRANSLRLAAKPGQIAQEDVSVVAGETGIQPGQTVTDLKTAGIDVQIQKGKVVIAKDKVLVAKGEPVTLGREGASHARHTPIQRSNRAICAPERQHIYGRAVLGINAETRPATLAYASGIALALSLEVKIINAYTIKTLIGRAYSNRLHLGIEGKASTTPA